MDTLRTPTGIVLRKKSGRPTVKPDDETLLEMYATRTAREIAEQYGVGPSTVRSWVSRIRLRAGEVSADG